MRRNSLASSITWCQMLIATMTKIPLSLIPTTGQSSAPSWSVPALWNIREQRPSTTFGRIRRRMNSSSGTSSHHNLHHKRHVVRCSTLKEFIRALTTRETVLTRATRQHRQPKITLSRCIRTPVRLSCMARTMLWCIR